MSVQSFLFAFIFCVLGFVLAGPFRMPVAGGALVVVGVFVLFAMRIAAEWERAIVLRLGRFAGVRGPGIYLIIPIIESVYRVIDTRRQSTTISAENTLTGDAVSVTVDSVLFWRVTDVSQAATSVVNYRAIIEQVAQTSLREVISERSIDEILGKREEIDQRIRDLLAKKTNGWGIEVQSVEMRDVKIPADLVDAMSRNAQANRERQARVTLAAAEVEIAERTAEAAKIYDLHPQAMKIRQMGLIYDMNKDRGATILVPTDLVDALSRIGTAMGSAAKPNS